MAERGDCCQRDTFLRGDLYHRKLHSTTSLDVMYSRQGRSNVFRVFCLNGLPFEFSNLACSELFVFSLVSSCLRVCACVLFCTLCNSTRRRTVLVFCRRTSWWMQWRSRDRLRTLVDNGGLMGAGCMPTRGYSGERSGSEGENLSW